MDGKVSDDAKPAVDGARFHDQSRTRSSEVTRAFASVSRAVSLGAQSELSEPYDVAISAEMEIVRTVD